MSLLELVVATSLIGVVGLSFGFLYVTAQRFLIQSINLTASQGEASFGLEHIKRRLLQAVAITNPAWPPVPPANGTLVLTNGGGTFQFTWEQSVAAGQVACQYRLTGTTLEFQRGAAGAWETIARGIQSVTFTRTGANVVAVEILARQTSGRDINRDTRLQTLVTPRGIL